jgi:hypothetical protein
MTTPQRMWIHSIPFLQSQTSSVLCSTQLGLELVMQPVPPASSAADRLISKKKLGTRRSQTSWLHAQTPQQRLRFAAMRQRINDSSNRGAGQPCAPSSKGSKRRWHTKGYTKGHFQRTGRHGDDYTRTPATRSVGSGEWCGKMQQAAAQQVSRSCSGKTVLVSKHSDMMLGSQTAGATPHLAVRWVWARFGSGPCLAVWLGHDLVWARSRAPNQPRAMMRRSRGTQVRASV